MAFAFIYLKLHFALLCLVIAHGSEIVSENAITDSFLPF